MIWPKRQIQMYENDWNDLAWGPNPNVRYNLSESQIQMYLQYEIQVIEMIVSSAEPIWTNWFVLAPNPNIFVWVTNPIEWNDSAQCQIKMVDLNDQILIAGFSMSFSFAHDQLCFSLSSVQLAKFADIVTDVVSLLSAWKQGQIPIADSVLVSSAC